MLCFRNGYTADHPELFSMERAPADNDKDDGSREFGAAGSHDQGFGMAVSLAYDNKHNFTFRAESIALPPDSHLLDCQIAL